MSETFVVDQDLLDELDRQRSLGWPDMHPEDYCHRCGGRNISWWADSDVWNAVMRPDGPDSPWLWNEIICPQCFAELFDQRFPTASWRLLLDSDTRGAKAFADRLTSRRSESDAARVDFESSHDARGYDRKRPGGRT